MRGAGSACAVTGIDQNKQALQDGEDLGEASARMAGDVLCSLARLGQSEGHSMQCVIACHTHFASRMWPRNITSGVGRRPARKTVPK
jgi:hypothetical protein